MASIEVEIDGVLQRVEVCEKDASALQALRDEITRAREANGRLADEVRRLRSLPPREEK